VPPPSHPGRRAGKGKKFGRNAYNTLTKEKGGRREKKGLTSSETAIVFRKREVQALRALWLLFGEKNLSLFFPSSKRRKGGGRKSVSLTFLGLLRGSGGWEKKIFSSGKFLSLLLRLEKFDYTKRRISS